MNADFYKMSPVVAMWTLPISCLEMNNDDNIQPPSIFLGGFQNEDSQSLPSEKISFDQTQTNSLLDQQCVSDDALNVEFQKLVKQWHEETFALSSLNKIYAHPAYQRIIGMGSAGLPFVLRELQNNQGHWFYALRFMAGENAKDVAAGINDYEGARAAWLEWGYKNHHI